jgi:hypothetical protein
MAKQLTFDDAQGADSASALQVQQPPRSHLRLIGFLLGISLGLLGLSMADRGRVVPQTRFVAVESHELAELALRELDRIRLHVPRIKWHRIRWHWPRRRNRAKTRPRHSVSQAWYLFIPPGDRRHENPDPSAPLTRWAQGEAFDTAQSCENRRREKLRDLNRSMQHDTRVAVYQYDLYQLKAWTYADCLSARDQRIEGAR